jgi:hypothetical protein
MGADRTSKFPTAFRRALGCIRRRRDDPAMGRHRLEAPRNANPQTGDVRPSRLVFLVALDAGQWMPPLVTIARDELR